MSLQLPGLLCLALATGTCALSQSAHFLDCNGGNDGADSLTPKAAWRTVAKANSYTYQPGDSLLLRRGTRCDGMLWPKGSGNEQAPIHLGAYGEGALPVIAGGSESAGLRLNDQQYWEIENLEVIGGTPYGIHIGGSVPVMRHFRITNVVVHDVTGTPRTKDSGLVVVAPDDKARTRIDDVIIDGVTVYETSEWAGIIVNGAGFDTPDGKGRGEHVEVRNSIVHDVAGDGILLARVSHGVIEHNVAWFTGMQETESIGTPNAIWEWMCRDCRVEFNEGYFTDSPGVDGGVFDIDYGDEDNLLRYNFGHDSQGYCVSVFGAEGASGNSTHSEIRHNTCIHNGRSPRLSKRQGAIFLYTWNGGMLDGVEIADNIVVWDPAIRVPAFQSTADFVGKLPNRFTGNTIIAVPRAFVSSKSSIEFSGSRYCAPVPTASDLLTRDEPGTAAAAKFPVAQAESDPAAGTPRPLCDCLEELQRSTAGTTPALSVTRPALPPPGHWELVAVLAPPGDPGAGASRSLIVLVESMVNQFGSLGLESAVLPTRSVSQASLVEWRANWNISTAVKIDQDLASRLRKTEVTAPGTLLLVSPSGQIAASWQSPVPPGDVWLQIQGHLGTPAGAQSMPVCRAQVPH